MWASFHFVDSGNGWASHRSHFLATQTNLLKHSYWR